MIQREEKKRKKLTNGVKSRKPHAHARLTVPVTIFTILVQYDKAKVKGGGELESQMPNHTFSSASLTQNTITTNPQTKTEKIPTNTPTETKHRVHII